MRPEPTEEELRLVYAHCRARRPATWPGTFEEAMADATLSRLVRITALHPPRAMRSPRVSEPAPPRTKGPEFPSLAQHQGQRFHTAIDRKRAAAGDRDDD